MVDELHEARLLARNIRFSGDSKITSTADESDAVKHIRAVFSQKGLLVNDSVTPQLSKLFQEVYRQLRIPPSVVTAYVYSSPEPQASCFATDASECIILFTSGLTNLLSEQELQFVIGHELGHFLLAHHGAHQGEESPIELMHQRAMEISVDRVGLVACRNVDVAARSMIKTLSGLNEDQLRFDVRQFMSQIENPDDAGFRIAQSSTHPSMIIRCRALLWFSMSNYFLNGESEHSIEQLAHVDKQIEADLDRYVDGPLRAQVEIIKRNLAFWLSASHVIADGVFDKHEQTVISENFGDEMLSKLVTTLSGMNEDDVESFITAKLNQSHQELVAAFPSDYESVLENITNNISKDFS